MIGGIVNKTRNEVGKLMEEPPAIEKRGKEVTHRKRPEINDDGYLENTTFIDGEEISAGTEIEDTKGFRKKINQQITGRKHVGGIRGAFSLLKKMGKKVVSAGSQLAFGGAALLGAYTLTSTALTGLGGWIGSTLPWVPGLIGPTATAVLGATGAYVIPALVGGYLGIKIAKGIRKIFRSKNKYVGYISDVSRNSASQKDITSNLNKENRTHSSIKLDIPKGTETTQEGDLIINSPIIASNLGLRTTDKETGIEVNGFYDANSRLWKDNDPVPEGTVIPNGSKWYRDKRISPVIPAGIGYREVKSFIGEELKSGPIKESIRIDNEEGAKFKGYLHLNTSTTFPFSYSDKRNPDHPATVRKGEESRPGAVIDIKSLPFGTIIPAGSFISSELRSEGANDINTITAPEISSGLVLNTTTYLRRDVQVSVNGILIPAGQQKNILVPDQSEEDLNKQINKAGVYLRYIPSDGIVPAGSRFPAGTKFPAGAELTKHIEDSIPSYPINRRFICDIKCGTGTNLHDIVNAHGITDNNIRLKIGAPIPAAGNRLEDFEDPDTGEIYRKGQKIPAGVCIPYNQAGGTDILEIPANMAIPGGSEIYDKSKRVTPKEVQEDIDKASGCLEDKLKPTHAPNFIQKIRDNLSPTADFELVAKAFESIEKCVTEEEKREMKAKLQKSIQFKISRIIHGMIQADISALKTKPEFPTTTKEEKINWIKTQALYTNYTNITNGIENLFKNAWDGDLEDAAKDQAKTFEEELNKKLSAKIVEIAA